MFSKMPNEAPTVSQHCFLGHLQEPLQRLADRPTGQVCRPQFKAKALRYRQLAPDCHSGTWRWTFILLYWWNQGTSQTIIPHLPPNLSDILSPILTTCTRLLLPLIIIYLFLFVWKQYLGKVTKKVQRNPLCPSPQDPTQIFPIVSVASLLKMVQPRITCCSTCNFFF